MNICKQALIQGRGTFDGEDLLTEFITWRKKFNITCLALGIEEKNKEKEQAHNLKQTTNTMERKL